MKKILLASLIVLALSFHVEAKIFDDVRGIPQNILCDNPGLDERGRLIERELKCIIDVQFVLDNFFYMHFQIWTDSLTPRGFFRQKILSARLLSDDPRSFFDCALPRSFATCIEIDLKTRDTFNDRSSIPGSWDPNLIKIFINIDNDFTLGFSIWLVNPEFDPFEVIGAFGVDVTFPLRQPTECRGNPCMWFITNATAFDVTQ